MDPDLQRRKGDHTAMNVTEDAVSRRLSASHKTYFYFTTASLTVCLVFALATIMVLIVQRKVSHIQLFSLVLLFFPLSEKNDLEVVFTALQNASFKKAAAYMKVNSPKLKWTDDVLQNIMYNGKGDLVIQTPGWYLVYCKLQFHVTNFSSNPTDLQLDLLINNSTNRQTLNTPCPSSNHIYQALSTLQLLKLRANDFISVKTCQYKYLDLSFLPNDSVLAVLRYSD
uniref:TNF superfamily member 8 n=1 Tax=Pelusios castaneus TaxID=367368 RepID=A0A8C8SPQ3_9SAUR